MLSKCAKSFVSCTNKNAPVRRLLFSQSSSAPRSTTLLTQGVRAAPLVLPSRGLHFQWNFSFKDWRNEKALREQADNNPADPDKQAALLKQMNKHNPAKVVERVECGTYANSEATLREYVKALYKENKLDQVKLGSVLAVGGAAAGAGVGDVSQVVPLKANSGFNTPVRVQLVRSRWESAIVLGMIVGVVLFIWYSEYSATTAGSQVSHMFNVPPGHTQIMQVDTSFEDVKGADEAKQELQEIVEYLRNPDKFTKTGAKLPKGVMMSGPAGTGKTLLARAMAGEAGVPFFYISGASFDEVYVGVGSKRVRQLFNEAANHAPCIVFIDEIDAVGGSREKAANRPKSDSTLQQLLTELDGFTPNQGVVVIAATNVPDTLDPALVRPGRFDRQVVVPLPDVKGRKQIIDLYLTKITVDDDVNSEVIARGTPGFSGADLSQLVNASAIKAAVQNKEKINMRLIEEAKDDILMGRMRKGAFMDEKTREMTAYHEGAHALVAIHTEGADPVHKATIIQRGHALGMVSQLPSGDQLSFSRQQMMARLAVLMAGRAAEDLMYGREGATSGASSDFMQASRLAFKMVTQWGMSDKLGMVYLGDRISQTTQQLIDDEVRHLVEQQYEYAKNVLVSRKEELDRVAKALLEKETMTGEEIKAVVVGAQEQSA